LLRGTHSKRKSYFFGHGEPYRKKGWGGRGGTCDRESNFKKRRISFLRNLIPAGKKKPREVFPKASNLSYDGGNW